MSLNIDQIFIANPITTNLSTDLMYFGQSPYTSAGNNVAMTFANFSAQFGIIGSALSPSQAVVTNGSSKLISLVYTPNNTASTIVSRDGAGAINVGALASTSLSVTGTSTLADLSSTSLSVTGTSTLAGLSSTSLSVTGTSTLASLSSTSLSVSGTTNINTSGSSVVNIGTGTATGQITIGSGSNNNSVNFVGNASTVAAFSSNSNAPQISIMSGAILRCYLGYNTTNGVLLTNGTNGNILQQLSGGASDVSLKTANNTLDDGSGNMAIVGNLTATSGDITATNLIANSNITTTNLTANSNITVKGNIFNSRVVTTPATGDKTITASQLLGGLIIAPSTSSVFTWTTDTGTAIYAAMGSPSVGTAFTTLFSNDNSSAGAVMTIAFGSGVTGNLRSNTLNNNQSMVIYFVVTGTNTLTCYS